MGLTVWLGSLPSRLQGLLCFSPLPAPTLETWVWPLHLTYLIPTQVPCICTANPFLTESSPQTLISNTKLNYTWGQGSRNRWWSCSFRLQLTQERRPPVSWKTHWSPQGDTTKVVLLMSRCVNPSLVSGFTSKLHQCDFQSNILSVSTDPFTGDSNDIRYLSLWKLTGKRSCWLICMTNIANIYVYKSKIYVYGFYFLCSSGSLKYSFFFS